VSKFLKVLLGGILVIPFFCFLVKYYCITSLIIFLLILAFVGFSMLNFINIKIKVNSGDKE